MDRNPERNRLSPRPMEDPPLEFGTDAVYAPWLINFPVQCLVVSSTTSSEGLPSNQSSTGYEAPAAASPEAPGYASEEIVTSTVEDLPDNQSNSS